MERHQIFSIVHDAILEVSPFAAEQLGNRDIKSQDTLIELGINSIDYAEIASIIMGHLNLDHSLDIFTKTNHVGDLVEIFYKMLADKIGFR